MIIDAFGIGVITSVFSGAVGVLLGIMIERYKWVRSVKLGKVVAVDGNLYNVSRVNVIIKATGQFKNAGNKIEMKDLRHRPATKEEREEAAKRRLQNEAKKRYYI